MYSIFSGLLNGLLSIQMVFISIRFISNIYSIIYIGRCLNSLTLPGRFIPDINVYSIPFLMLTFTYFSNVSNEFKLNCSIFCTKLWNRVSFVVMQTKTFRLLKQNLEKVLICIEIQCTWKGKNESNLNLLDMSISNVSKSFVLIHLKFQYYDWNIETWRRIFFVYLKFGLKYFWAKNSLFRKIWMNLGKASYFLRFWLCI